MLAAARLAAVAAAWAGPAVLYAATRHAPRIRRPGYPAAIALAAAVTGAMLADELTARRGDRVYEACLQAVTDREEIRARERARHPKPRAARQGPRPVTDIASLLPGRPAAAAAPVAGWV